MRFRIPRWASIVAAAPLAVGVQHADSGKTYTSIYVAGGAGDYAAIVRGCENEVLSKEQFSFRDYGAAVDHKLKVLPVRVGVRAGRLEEKGAVNQYVNPHLSLEGRKVSIGYGPVFAERDFSTGSGTLDGSETWHSGHVRLGDLDHFYFSSSYFENVPLYSGGGHFELGFGGRPAPRFGLWMGLSVEPYDAVGLGIKMDYRAVGGLSAVAKGRLGESEGLGESAVSFGLQYRWNHAREARPLEAAPAPPPNGEAPVDSVAAPPVDGEAPADSVPR